LSEDEPDEEEEEPSSSALLLFLASMRALKTVTASKAFTIITLTLMLMGAEIRTGSPLYAHNQPRKASLITARHHPPTLDGLTLIGPDIMGNSSQESVAIYRPPADGNWPIGRGC